MALMKASEVPKDAVMLSENDAVTYAWDLVSEWDSFLDTWALRYGSVILGGINALSGVLINSHYRNKLKLSNYGYFASVIPITALPGVLTALFHRHLVATDILLMKKTCPICYETRSAFIQLGLGIVYPMILGPTSALMFSHRYATYRTPNLQEGPKVLFKFLAKLTKPFKGTLATLAVTQFVASSAITYFEMRNHLTLRRKMIEIEKKLLREQGDL